jgi:hypothetical protein
MTSTNHLTTARPANESEKSSKMSESLTKTERSTLREHILTNIANYEKLVDLAQKVGYRYACLLYGKQPYGLHQPSDLEVSMDQEHVWIRWYSHGEYDSEEFPTRLLWGTAEDIAVEVEIEKMRRAQRAAENAERQRQEQEARDRATLERLKAKYEPRCEDGDCTEPCGKC